MNPTTSIVTMLTSVCIVLVGIVTGLHEIIYRVTIAGRTEIFLEDQNADKLIAPANPALGGVNRDELYSTNLSGNSVGRIKGVPRGQALYHQAT